jgi:DNA repair protein RadC
MPLSLTARENRTIYRAMRILETRFKDPEAAISTPADGRDYLRLRFAGKLVEEFHAIWLNAQNLVIGSEVLFAGSLTQTSVYPREVVRAALRANAAAVVFAHNHPSGKAQPSQADVMLTRTLKGALALVDVGLLDHFVVTERETTSLRELNYV